MSFDSAQKPYLGEITQMNSIYETSVSQMEGDELKDTLMKHAREMLTFKHLNQCRRMKEPDYEGYTLKPVIEKNHDWNSTEAKRQKFSTRERPLLFNGIPLV